MQIVKHMKEIPTYRSLSRETNDWLYPLFFYQTTDLLKTITNGNIDGSRTFLGSTSRSRVESRMLIVKPWP